MKANNKRIYLDLHVIQTVPPSNINRDDVGSPKTAQFGGVRRARVSSQSWKRAMRNYFNEKLIGSNIGIRTCYIIKYVADKILELDSSLSEEKAMSMAEEMIKLVNIGIKDNKTKALFFLGNSQAEALAKAAVEGIKKNTEIEKKFKKSQPIDIALFGRMVADNPNLNEDASAQVAHAISTHGIQTEFDFFTAVDDLSSGASLGAEMLGSIEFNSATLYRYANIAVHEFLNQLGDKEAVIDSIKLFIDAFAKSMPTGKINTFANQTLPQFIMINIREDRPISLVNGFENPVKGVDGYVEKSIKKLVKEFNNARKFVEDPIKSVYVSVAEIDGLSEIGEELGSLNEMNKKIAEVLNSVLVSD